jgi:hypothetical protein
MVMRRIRSCWLKNILIKLICLLPSPTMTKRISCPPCSPNGWGQKGHGAYPAPAYVDLVQGSVIDIAISPQQATISALSHVRKADIVGVSSLRRGVAEAIEAVAHGDETTSRVVGRSIDEIKAARHHYWRRRARE